ncbi:MAG: amidohydrolase family protein [Anaerolineales bacterium]|nr:amidohydrolase family protein [Anaerolineales bacterium]
MVEQQSQVDFLFSGGTLLTMDKERRVITNGALAVKDGRIVWLGPAAEASGRFAAAQTLNLTGKVLVPGLVNAHGHWAMTLFRGLVDDCTLEAWLEKIWKVEAATISAENVVAGSELAMIEMIRSGTTCAADMYWHYGETTEAAKKAGFRMVNGPIFARIAGFEKHRNTTYNMALEYLDHYQNDPLIHLCLQLHATYTTNRSILEEAAQIVKDRSLMFITHASESRGEMENVRQQYDGMTPIEVLDAAGLLHDRTLLAHCVHLSDAEIERLAETGASVVHCPSSNLKLSSGVARVADMVKAGVTVAIGTDGTASNNDLDLLHEAQLAALLQKGVTGDPTVLPAEKVVEMLTIDGARAVGLDKVIGSLEVGKLADLTVFDFDSYNLTPCYDVYSHLVYATSTHDVSDVMINGRLVMQDRQMLTLDEADVKARVRAIAQKVRDL